MWIRSSLHITQLLTGHGSVRSKLHALGLADDSQCNCHQPAEETAQYAFYFSLLEKQSRVEFVLHLRNEYD